MAISTVLGLGLKAEPPEIVFPAFLGQLWSDDLCIGAEVSRPATIVKAHNHNADDAAHKARSGQESFVLPRHHGTATLIRHRFPAVRLGGKLRETDAMKPIDAACTALSGLSLRRQIKQTGVLPQATEDDDSQICQRLQYWSSRISTIGHKPDFALDAQRTNRLDEPCHETDRQLQFRAEFPAMMIESRNAMRESSMPAIDVTRTAIFPVSGTFAFTVFFRRRFGVSSRFRLSCCDEGLFGLCCACGRFDCLLRLAILGSFGVLEAS